MSLLFLNEDPNHFVYNRDLMGATVGLEEILAFIDQYESSSITDFMININASVAWYPAVSRENAIAKYEEVLARDGEINTDIYKSAVGVRMLYDIYAVKKIQMHKIWVNRLREKGIRPWISIRTNDIHNNDDETNFLHSHFFTEHKNLRRASHHESTDYYDNALDFCEKTVRDHLFALICEVLDTFDMTGLEMDWMREIYSLHIGRELEGMKLLTEFMGDVKAKVLEAEKKWGHPIKVSTRVPANPIHCMRLGFDVLDWVDKGYIDTIVVTPRWATTDNDMPIDLWNRMLRGKNVKLLAGLEILIDPYFTEPNKKYLFQTVETTRGSAAAYLSMGADGIYLFNFMDDIGKDGKYYSPIHEPQNYKQVLSDIGSLETISDKPRRHVVTYCDILPPGVHQKSPLPLKCGKRTTGNPAFVGKTRYHSLRIPTGIMPDNANIQLVLGIDDKYNLCASDLDVFVNAKKVELDGEVKLPYPASAGVRYYAFTIPYTSDFPTASIVEIGAPGNRVTILWAEIGVNMKYRGSAESGALS